MQSTQPPLFRLHSVSQQDVADAFNLFKVVRTIKRTEVAFWKARLKEIDKLEVCQRKHWDFMLASHGIVGESFDKGKKRLEVSMPAAWKGNLKGEIPFSTFLLFWLQITDISRSNPDSSLSRLWGTFLGEVDATDHSFLRPRQIRSSFSCPKFATAFGVGMLAPGLVDYFGKTKEERTIPGVVLVSALHVFLVWSCVSIPYRRLHST